MISEGRQCLIADSKTQIGVNGFNQCRSVLFGKLIFLHLFKQLIEEILPYDWYNPNGLCDIDEVFNLLGVVVKWYH